MFPESPLTRHAAFAVVWDLCLTDDERRIQVDRFLATQELFLLRAPFGQYGPVAAT